MAYVWTPELATGNGIIDSEHKQLIQAINELMEACAQGKGRDTLDKTCKFLQEYTAKHFSHEEELQQQSHYPDFTNHKRYHEEFKRVVAELSQQLQKDGPTVALVAKVNTSIGVWLINHIKREDVKVAAHIREAK